MYQQPKELKRHENILLSSQAPNALRETQVEDKQGYKKNSEHPGSTLDNKQRRFRSCMIKGNRTKIAQAQVWVSEEKEQHRKEMFPKNQYL